MEDDDRHREGFRPQGGDTCSDDQAPSTARSTESALRQKEASLRAVLESSLDLAYRRDLRTDTYDYISPSVESVLGISHDDLASMSVRALVERVHPDDRQRMREAIVLAGTRGTIEYRFRGDDGRYRWVEDHFSVVRDGDGRPAYRSGIVRDVGEQKRAQEELRSIAARQGCLLRIADALRGGGEPMELQRTACGILAEHLGVEHVSYDEHADGGADVLAPTGVRREEMMRRAIHQGVAEDPEGALASGSPLVVSDVQEHHGFSASVRERYRGLGIGALMVVPLVRPTGPRWTLSVASRAPRDWTSDEVALVRDVLDRTWAAVEAARSEQALRELNRTLERRVEERTREVRELAEILSVAEQEERQRLSYLLHDDLQQLLYAIQMKLALAEHHELRGETDGAVARTRDAVRLLEDAIRRTRQLTVDLNPPILEGESLTEAIDWLRTHMLELHGLEVDVRAPEEIYVARPELRILFFQIAREVLFDIAKRAGVERAAVEVTSADGRIRLAVSHQGRPFDPYATGSDARGASGLGLFRARERLRMQGGTLEVGPVDGGGTRVVAEASLDPDDSREQPLP